LIKFHIPIKIAAKKYIATYRNYRTKKNNAILFNVGTYLAVYQLKTKRFGLIKDVISIHLS